MSQFVIPAKSRETWREPGYRSFGNYKVHARGQGAGRRIDTAYTAVCEAFELVCNPAIGGNILALDYF
jgi:hypothetical protein